MNKPCQVNLKLENLEERQCPTFVIRAIGPDLYITGTPIAGPTSAEQFLVKEVALNKFQIQDVTATATKTYGTFSASRNIFAL